MPDTFGYPQQTPQSPSTGLFHDRERPIRRPLAHRLDEFPAGYSSADCSPAGSASASPTVDHFALMSSRRSILFCRTVNSVLTVCLSSGDQPKWCRRTPRHTTHHQHFPERVTITRPHHPFHGQSLEVLREAHMPSGLQFVLILPDGSKSLVPAEWTDFNTADSQPPTHLVGSLDDLLRLRGLVDALLHRALPVVSGASQESHAAVDSELQ